LPKYVLEYHNIIRRIAVKRTVLLICALVLLLDLADDGYLGKVKYVAPDSPAKSLDFSVENHKSGTVDFHPDLLAANFPGTPCQSLSQPATPVVWTAVKIIVSSLLASSGGLPL
jgi:hypothetical protein